MNASETQYKQNIMIHMVPVIDPRAPKFTS